MKAHDMNCMSGACRAWHAYYEAMNNTVQPQHAVGTASISWDSDLTITAGQNYMPPETQITLELIKVKDSLLLQDSSTDMKTDLELDSNQSKSSGRLEHPGHPDVQE